MGGGTLDAEALDAVEALYEVPVVLHDVGVAELAQGLHLRLVALRVGGSGGAVRRWERR